jgi:hypothetical protein
MRVFVFRRFHLRLLTVLPFGQPGTGQIERKPTYDEGELLLASLMTI